MGTNNLKSLVIGLIKLSSLALSMILDRKLVVARA